MQTSQTCHLGGVELRTTLPVVGRPIADDVALGPAFDKMGQGRRCRLEAIEETVDVLADIP